MSIVAAIFNASQLPAFGNNASCIRLIGSNAFPRWQTTRRSATAWFTSDYQLAVGYATSWAEEFQKMRSVGLGHPRGAQTALRSRQSYLNGSEHLVLVVNDLKHGAAKSGATGLWVDVATEGYFANLRVSSQRPNGSWPRHLTMR